MINISYKYDEFTGETIVMTGLVGLVRFKDFETSSVIALKPMDQNIFFSLIYSGIDNDYKDGLYTFDIHMIMDADRYPNLVPHWKNEWPLIVDGERVILEVLQVGERNGENVNYKFNFETLQKLSNAKEIKYSLRGINTTVNGTFDPRHIDLFKAFLSYCTLKQKEGEEILSKIIYSNNTLNEVKIDESPKSTSTKKRSTVKTKSATNSSQSKPKIAQSSDQSNSQLTESTSTHIESVDDLVEALRIQYYKDDKLKGVFLLIALLVFFTVSC
jgi:hypothetical protein